MAETHKLAIVPLPLLTRTPVLVLLFGELTVDLPIPRMPWALAILAITIRRPRRSRRRGNRLGEALRRRMTTVLTATVRRLRLCPLYRLAPPQLLTLVVQTAWIGEFTVLIRTISRKTKSPPLALFDHGISFVKKWEVPGTIPCIYAPL